MTFTEEKAQALRGRDDARVYRPLDDASPFAYVEGVFHQGPAIGGFRIQAPRLLESRAHDQVCDRLSRSSHVKLAGEVWRQGRSGLEVHLAFKVAAKSDSFDRTQKAMALAAVIEELTKWLRVARPAKVVH